MIAVLAVIAIILLIAYFLLGLTVHIALGIGGLIIALIIWAVIGWLAGLVMRGGGYGLIGDILLGLVGGLVGGIIFGLLGIGDINSGLIGTVIVGVIGSVIVIAIGRAIGAGRVA
ncbi:MAG TPA: GlsB/YeaQ/YmgE family stress response membrane protein [Phototrophicaceae bacterium]|nr:GlsB/YeaQ/YmgE family stress response membrane protein [Phototrophicaceae bacterium]